MGSNPTGVRDYFSFFVWAHVRSGATTQVSFGTFIQHFNLPHLTLEGIILKSYTKAYMWGGGGINRTPPPSTFDTIHPIDLIFVTYNELSIYFQLLEITWCLIGFHSNHNHINDATSCRHVGFPKFQIILYIRIKH